MPERDADFRPANSSSVWPAVVVVVALLGGAFAWWYWSMQKDTGAESPGTMAPPLASAPADVPAPPPAEPPGPQNPVDALAAPDAKLPALNDADARVTADLNDLLGRKAVAAQVQTDGFVRRLVATVDNLTREQAPSRVWPVHPSPDRFLVQGDGEIKTISPDNGARYTPFVLLAESVDAKRAAALYAKLYPLFQQAYEELGYSGRYFNDRLVAVIDHLIASPEPTGPVQVKLFEVKGVAPSERPWVRYEFVDPELSTLSAGQKMMVRMGPVNERRLKARLAEFRRQIATGEVSAKK